MKSVNRVLALMLAVLMTISAMPVFARAAEVTDFSDFPAGSWSEEAMTAAVNNHLLEGKGNGTIAPKDYLTRAEAAAVINRAFGATVKADISSFTDISTNDWYYSEFEKAVNMQTITGVSSTQLNPTGYITRESMLTVLARALVLDSKDASELSKFVDASAVSSWAVGYVSAMAERGYVNGNENGELNPQGYITREEFAQVMHNIFKVYVPDTVTITGVEYGTTVIRAKDVALNNVVIDGDLIVGDGVSTGNLTLTNVTVTGRILFRGGEGAVKLTNCSVGENVIINDVNGVVNFLNYRAEAPFIGIKENTPATFLNMSINTGGGGGSTTPSRAEYTVREYTESLNGKYSQYSSDDKKADYGKTITYTERTITGFTFDPSHPDSVLSGSNRGKLVLKAYYTRNKYKVSFDGYETELPYEQRISADETLKNLMEAAVEDNKEDGYTTRFNTEPDGTGDKVTLEDTKVGTKDLPIYAIKAPIEYKINYNLNGGKIEGEYEKTFNVEDGDYTLPTPVKTGYTFAGWTDADGNPAAVIPAGSIGDKTFTANWTAIEYTITFVPGENGTMDGVADVKTSYTVEDDSYTLPEPIVTRDDYVFLGWYEDAEFTKKATVIAKGSTGDKTYYAKIAERTYAQYTITFDGVEYTVTEGEKISEAVDGQGNKLGDAMDAVIYPTGYEADDFRIMGDDTTVITKDTIATGNMEIEAAKKLTVYTIVYELDGGVLDGTQKTSYTVEDADYTLPTPTKGSYTFLGWFENGNKVTRLDTADAENKTYYASWQAPAADVYTITFKGTGYAVTENNALSTNADLKAAMEEAANKTGYDVTFNTKEDGTGTAVTTDTVPAGDMTIYVIETAIEYTITYVTNGGDAVDDDTYTVENGDITLPVPARDGYVFRGWYEKSDFSGEAVEVLDTADAEDKTYYAKWAEDNAVLSFDHEINGDVITLKVMLSAIPADIDEIAAMSLRYAYDDTKLQYVSTSSNVGNAAASDGYISWYTESGYITADTLTANGNVLFTLTFSKAEGASGETEVSYSFAEITASEPENNPVITTKYTRESETINLGEEVEEYTITYVTNGGNDIADGTYTVNDEDITLPIPTRTGYTFKGWYEKEDFSGEAVTVLDTADAENKTYYAKWVIETATLDFSSEIDGDTIRIYVTLDEIPSDIDDIAAFTLKYKHPENKLAFVSGSTAFEGNFSAVDGNISWYTADAAITSESLKANGNILAALVFTKAPSASGVETFEYTFAELVASEPEGQPAIAEKYKTETEEVQLDASVYVVTFGRDYNITAGQSLSSNAELLAAMTAAQNKTGYNVTFNTAADGTGAEVTATTVPTGDMTIYAVEEAIVYTITYELGGIGTLPADAYTEYTIETEYTLPVPANTETHVFAAWYENEELTGIPVTEITAGTTGDLTFYAKWEEIPEDAYTITYEVNGGTLDGTQKVTYISSELPYTLPVPVKGEVPFLGWYETDDFSGDPVTEIAAGTTGDKTYYAKWQEYTVQFYLGTKRTANIPDSIDGDGGKVTVEHGAALTQEDVDRELGMLPSEYNMAEGYTDSDGVVHEVTPELWYEKDGEWVKYIPEEVPVVSDMNVHLFTRYVSVAYSTDLQIKGIDMAEIGDISVTVAYDSNTDIGKTFLDLLTNAGITIDRVLDQIEGQGYDLYQMAIDKAASFGLVDTDGNILNPNVPVPLHRLITEDMIMAEINRYIDDNIDNEEFIADILRNDIVVDMILNDEELKHSAMGDPEIREIFLTDDFIKEIIRNHPEFVDIMIDHEDFISLIIDNDATFDYVLKDDTMVAKILANEAFKSKVIEKGTDYIVESYFGTDGDQEIKDYITKQLKSDDIKAELKEIIHNDAEVKNTLKETLKEDAQAQEIIKEEIKKMLEDDTKKDEIKQKIKDYLLANPDVVKADVKDYIKSKKDDADFKAKVKSYIKDMKNDEDFKAKVKSYIEGMKNDPDFKAEVEAYIKAKKNDSTFKSKVADYIEGKKEDAEFKAKVEGYIEGKKEDAEFKAKVEDYIEGKKEDTEFKAEVETYIKGKKEDAEFKAKVETYIEGKKEDAEFKAEIKAYAKDKAKADKETVLGNDTVKAAFLSKANEVIESEGLTGSITAEEVLRKYLDGSLASDPDYSEIASQIDSAYNSAFEDNYDTYFEDNYDDLFEKYFAEYFTTNYDTLFEDYFTEYFNTNYDSLFTDYFSEYFTANYDKLFEDNFTEYFNTNYDSLFEDYFTEYFNANYDSLFEDNFTEYFSTNYDSLFEDYFTEYFNANYDSLFEEYFEEYFEENYNTLFTDYFEEYFEENYSTLFEDHFSDYYDTLSDEDFDELVDKNFDSFYTKQFDTLYDDYFDDYFDTVFDSLYESNVEKWAKLAYDEPTTTETVVETIEGVISDLVDSYIAGTADQELKDFIDKIVEEFGVKEYVRENYSTDAELKATIDDLVKENAKTIIDDYANNRASEDIVKLIDDNMHKYIEEIVDDYVSYELDEELMAFVDEEINIYMLDYINKYISGEDRELLSKLVPTYANDAVEAIKETDAFKNTISDFASGEGVRVNEGNVMFIEILDELMHTYNYDKLAADFLPENIEKIVDFIGHDMVAHIVDDYFAAFCLEMDEAIAKLNADLDAGIEGTEYKFSTSPAVRINYMEIVKSYYDKLMDKMREKINSQSKIPVSSNPYAQRLMDMDYFALFFDEGAPADEYKSGYKLKDDIMEYYNNALEVAVLVHDAVTYYGAMDEYTLEEKLSAASEIIGTYANKANDVIMNYINTGELPKGYTPQELADLILDKVLGVNGSIDNAYDKIEDYYKENEDKILEYIEKAKTFYEEYLDRDYTNIIDLANMSIYSDGDVYMVYQIILENGENAFDVDDAATAIFDSPNYQGISKIEDAMAKIESKIKGCEYTPEKNVHISYVDAYKGTVESREIRGYETGTHTIALQRYLRYFKE